MEPLLEPNPDRWIMLPIKYQPIWDMYIKARNCFWLPPEIDFTHDYLHWTTLLSDDDRHFFSHVLAFFAASDGIVNENLATRLINVVQIPEARAFYTFQAAMETIHGETYAIMIDTLIKDNEEKDKLFHAIKTMPCVAKKARWAIKYMESQEASFGENLVAFAAVEGIFFSGSFCAIYWLRKRGNNIMPGLCGSNELIARDEGLHCDFACLLFSMLKNVPATTTDIIKEAVVIEKEFVSDALPVKLIGMNAELMCQYIEFVADRLLVALGVAKVYHAANPFPWMESISLEGKTNFFEKRVTEYSKPVELGPRVFRTDAYY